MRYEAGIESICDRSINSRRYFFPQRPLFRLVHHSDDLAVRNCEAIRALAPEKPPDRILTRKEAMYKRLVHNPLPRLLLVIVGCGEIASGKNAHSHCVKIGGRASCLLRSLARAGLYPFRPGSIVNVTI